ncbi:MAG: hypothetical protein IJG45_06145 [Oscillospiraceae bacterium]|nr:hypothetical protein [Oscillospiraceae bacterium]
MKRMTAVLLLIAILLLTACTPSSQSAFDTAQQCIDMTKDELIAKIGKPVSESYASSCLGDGEDGELYYDGFTVYTYRDTDGTETVYDVMENALTN